MVNEAMYCVKVYSDTKTIAVMDKFEKIDHEGKKLYRTLKLEDVFLIFYKHQFYRISLLVERMQKDIDYLDSSLTFTDLKRHLNKKAFTTKNKDKFVVVNAVFESINNVQLPTQKDECLKIVFEQPVKFNAQNSSNRRGYGSRYYFEECVYEGTLYGETTGYLFTGIECTRW